MSCSVSHGNIRFVTSVEVRATGNKQMIFLCKLLNVSFIAKLVAGIDGFNTI